MSLVGVDWPVVLYDDISSMSDSKQTVSVVIQCGGKVRFILSRKESDFSLMKSLVGA